MLDPVVAHPTHHASAKRSAVPQLDTIRAVAMLGIFSHHLWKTVIVSPEGSLQRLLDVLFSTASDGVIVFNIISGFLLASPYLGSRPRPFPSYRVFLQKRALRIIPPYYVALLVFTAANILRFGVPVPSALATLLQHLLFVNSLDYSNMYLNLSHFWYIGLLAQFYLLYPLLLRLFQRVGEARAAFYIIVGCWVAWIILDRLFPTPSGSPPGMIENLMHFNLPGRLPEFAVGMWLAALQRHSERWSRQLLQEPFSWFVGAMVTTVLAGAFLPPGDQSLPLVHIFHVALTVLLYLFFFTRPWIASAGEWPLVKDLAAHSYALYIVHYPLFSYLGVMPSKVSHTLGSFVFLMVLLLPVSYGTARILDLAAAGIMGRFRTERC